jgi:hypothetical protein
MSAGIEKPAGTLRRTAKRVECQEVAVMRIIDLYCSVDEFWQRFAP